MTRDGLPLGTWLAVAARWTWAQVRTVVWYLAGYTRDAQTRDGSGARLTALALGFAGCVVAWVAVTREGGPNQWDVALVTALVASGSVALWLRTRKPPTDGDAP